jgi:cholera toxin transcriptional activator
VNRIREALGDKARNPRFIETLARRGYRFVAPVQRIDGNGDAPVPAIPASPVEEAGLLDRILASPEELPKTSNRTVRTLFLLLQMMYLGFYVGALANLPEIEELFSALGKPTEALMILIVTAALLIPVRVFLISAVLFQAPGLRGKFLRMWPFVLPFDVLWSLSPFLLLHHMDVGVALACMAPLVYSPFAQRALVVMGAGELQA